MVWTEMWLKKIHMISKLSEGIVNFYTCSDKLIPSSLYSFLLTLLSVLIFLFCVCPKPLCSELYWKPSPYVFLLSAFFLFCVISRFLSSSFHCIRSSLFYSNLAPPKAKQVAQLAVVQVASSCRWFFLF